MLDQIVDAAGEFAPSALIALVVLARRGFQRAWIVVLVGALYLADAFLLNIRVWLPGLPHPPGAWNWDGKLAALLLALVVLAVLPTRLRAQVGIFRIPHRATWIPLIAIAGAICALAFARTALFSSSAPFEIETIAFQATMPGLHEELAFRGVWWVLLAFALDPGQISEGKIPRWTLLATSLLFGAVHAIDLTAQGEVAIDWLFFAATALSGWLYGLLQGIGRAIWIPVVAHNLANIIIYAWQMSMP